MAEKIETSAPSDANRTERVLLFMILAVVVVSVLAFFTRLVGTAMGVADGRRFDGDPDTHEEM